MTFPNDENGDVLKRMLDSGFDFSKPYSVEFFAVLSTEEEADMIAQQYLAEHRNGDKLDNIETEPHEIGGMELILAKTMYLTPENITDFEAKLRKRVSEHKGYLDGWGVLQE